MKQTVKPGVVVGVVLGGIALIVLIGFWVLRQPSATATNLPPAQARAAQQAMMKENHGPTADQRRQIEEWKKQHPGAYTRF